MNNLSKLIIFTIADGSCPVKQPQPMMVKTSKLLILPTANNVCVVKLLSKSLAFVKFFKFLVEEGIVMDKLQLKKTKLLRFLMPSNQEKSDSNCLSESSRIMVNSCKDSSIPNEEMKSMEVIFPSIPNSVNALKSLK